MAIAGGSRACAHSGEAPPRRDRLGGPEKDYPYLTLKPEKMVQLLIHSMQCYFGITILVTNNLERIVFVINIFIENLPITMNNRFLPALVYITMKLWKLPLNSVAIIS